VWTYNGFCPAIIAFGRFFSPPPPHLLRFVIIWLLLFPVSGLREKPSPKWFYDPPPPFLFRLSSLPPSFCIFPKRLKPQSLTPLYSPFFASTVSAQSRPPPFPCFPFFPQPRGNSSRRFSPIDSSCLSPLPPPFSFLFLVMDGFLFAPLFSLSQGLVLVALVCSSFFWRPTSLRVNFPPLV